MNVPRGGKSAATSCLYIESTAPIPRDSSKDPDTSPPERYLKTIYVQMGRDRQGLTKPPPEMYPSAQRTGHIAGSKHECPIGQDEHEDASTPL